LEKHELVGRILQVIDGYLGDRCLMLRQGTVIDATIIYTLSSTKIKDGKHDSEMHQSKEANMYFFGMKAHIGVDAESGLVHSLVGAAAKRTDVTQVVARKSYASGDAGYDGGDKRPEHQNRTMIWSIAVRSSSYRRHGKREFGRSTVAQDRIRQGPSTPLC
jgi:IS5 family transposase